MCVYEMSDMKTLSHESQEIIARTENNKKRRRGNCDPLATRENKELHTIQI